MKKYLLLGLVLLGTLFANAGKAEAASTLRQCYQEKGLAWTSVSQRAVKAAELGIFYYKGTAAQNTQFKNLLCTDKLGFSVATGYQRALRVGASASQDYFQVTSLALRDGTILDINTLGGKVFLNVEPGSTKEEIVMCTGINTTTIRFTGCTRGLAFSGTSTASVSTNAKTHNASSIIVMSNVHYVYEQYVDVNDKTQTLAGDKTVTGTWTFSDHLPRSTTTAPTLNSELVTLGYLTTVSTTGCANASTVVRGCVEKATNSETENGTAAGATGAQLFVGPDSWLEYADAHFSNNFAVGENVSAGNILYMSSTGKYMIAHANVQSEVDRIAAVSYDAATTNNFPRTLLDGSLFYGSVTMASGTTVYLSDTGTATTTPGTIRKVIGRAMGGVAWKFVPLNEQTNVNPISGVSSTIPISNASSTLNPRWLGNVFGNCSDGNVTTTASTTLTRDMHYNNWYVSSTVVVNTGGYQVFACGTITIAANATTTNSGNNGTAASGVTPGTGGAATTAGSLPASTAGVSGGAGVGPGPSTGGAGVAGTSKTYSVVSSAAVAGGAGGAGNGSAAGAVGAAGTATLEQVVFGTKFSTTSLVSGQEITALNVLGAYGVSDYLLSPSPGAGGGSGGGCNGTGSNRSGAGGGSGSSGGPLVMSAASIVNSGAIISLGGAGGAGGNAGGGDNTSGGGGGGGGGGDGGVVALIYSAFSGNTPLVTGGAGGALGNGNAGGSNGSAGPTGNAGKLFRIKL